MFDSVPGSAGGVPVPSDDPVFLLAAYDVRQALEYLCEEPPSSRTLRALELLADCPMTSTDRMLYAALWDRQEAATAAHAMQARVRAAVPETAGWTAQPDLVEGELAALLRRSEQALARELAFGRRVDEALPCSGAFLASGDISLSHVRALEELTGALSVEDAARVDAEVAERALTTTAARFRRIVRRAIERLGCTPDQQARARRSSGARWIAEGDGIGTLAVRMPTEQGVAALDALNQRARAAATPGDERTHGMRQADALLAALLGPEGSVTATIVATVDLQTLLGLRAGVVDVDGQGAAAAQALRAALAQGGGTVHRLVYDEVTGNALDYTVRGYVADRTLRRLLEVRDVTCRFPNCNRRARRCDTEHCVAYDAGGATSTGNCSLLCRRHHNRKTAGAWRYRRDDPRSGATRWLSPGGFGYVQDAARYTRDGPDPGDVDRIDPAIGRIDPAIGRIDPALDP